MKTILNLKQYVILLVAAFATTSCLDSDDPAFQVAGMGYVIQTVNEKTGMEKKRQPLLVDLHPLFWREQMNP